MGRGMQERSAGIDASAPDPGGAARRTGAWLVLLTLAAIALRVALALRPMVIEPDGAFYARLAQEFLRGSGAGGFHPAWPPFYPALIAAAARLLELLHCTGGLPADAPLAVERAARLVSALAGGLLVPVVFLLARRVGGPRLAWGAAFLTLGHPTLVDFSTQVMTEATFTLLFATTLALLGAAGRVERSWPAAGLGGLAAGLALLTRPEAFLLLAAGTATLALARRRAAATLFLGVALAVSLPHVARVSRSVGHLSLGAKSDYNLIIAYAGHPGVPPLVRSRSIYNNLTGAPPRVGFPEPIPRFDAAALLRHDTLAPAANFLRQWPKSVTGLFSLATLPVAALALLGLWRRRRSFSTTEKRWFMLWAGYVTLYAFVFVYRRFFAAFLPLLLIEAAAGCAPPALPVFRGRRALLPAAGLALLGMILAVLSLTRADQALELRALGERLRARDPVAPGAAPPQGVMARRPTVAWYADRPILALPEGGVAEVARGAAERGAGWVVLDERDLGREAPELARLAGARPDPLAPPPAGWTRADEQVSAGRRAVLYGVRGTEPP